MPADAQSKDLDYYALVKLANEGDLAAFRKALGSNPGLAKVKDERGATLLFLVDRKEAVSLLLENGIDVNVQSDNGETILHRISYQISSNEELMSFLISKGAKIDIFDSEGATPLHNAAGHHLAMVKLLLENGADVNAKKDGRECCGTPLHKAAKTGTPDIVDYLIQKGAQVNAIDGRGQTPLFQTTTRISDSSKDIEVAELLIKKGANVNAKDGEGYTALHLTAQAPHTGVGRKLCQLFVKSGANVNAKGNDGETALTIAKNSGNTELCNLLIRLGAK
ncbi:MAG: ankyrin repeat domain-containing protein [Candidatus Ozemobacteraceae bacterium]